ncbi:PHB depolymerase family esterase [Demequina rhizosphaerae]|uniref:PHB depolymerase family esterase n=1 Tax=Demequina rhizosphaerae TaxID=1638985 RepID=UPI0007836AAE|nr:PHB depolymerase family esterase [Demequina rhizosphaerae]
MTALWTRTAAVTAAALAATACGAAATAAVDTDGATAIDATLITQVAPDGLKVAAVAIEYDRELKFGQSGLDVAAFDVDVDLGEGGIAPLVGERTVTAAYTSATPEITGEQRAGRYVILELDQAEATATASYVDWSTTITHYYDLSGGYTVAQIGDIGKRNHVVAAQPDNVVTSSDVDNLLIDDYAVGSLATTAGPVLDYRYFTPEGTAEKDGYPLVVSLHGFGESGSNNFSQLAGNQISTVFASDERQKADPAYVLSPQADPFDATKGAWWAPQMQAAVIELVEDFVASHPDVDTSRIYLTGLSMGSYGSWAILQEHSDLFAGAVVVCGGGVQDVEAAAAELADFPIWAVHSEDDFVVDYYADGSDFRVFEALESAGTPVVWSEWSGLLPDAEQEVLAKAAAKEAKHAGSEHIFTTIEAGTTPVFSHLSWIPTYSSDVILDWLFAQDADS